MQLLHQPLLRGSGQAIEVRVIAQQPFLVLRGKVLVLIEPLAYMSRRRSAGIGGPGSTLISRISIGPLRTELTAVGRVAGLLANASVVLGLALIGHLLILIGPLPIPIKPLLILIRPRLVLVRSLLILVLPLLILILPLLLVLLPGRLPCRLALGKARRRWRRLAALSGNFKCGQTEKQDRSGYCRRTHTFRVSNPVHSLSPGSRPKYQKLRGLLANPS